MSISLRLAQLLPYKNSFIRPPSLSQPSFQKGNFYMEAYRDDRLLIIDDDRALCDQQF